MSGAVEVPREFVFPHDRPLRPPARPWAMLLRKQVNRVGEQDNLDFPQRTAQLFNESALLAAYAGEREWTRQLIASQLAWFAHLRQGKGSHFSGALVAGAIINHCRMARIAGHTDSALADLTRLANALTLPYPRIRLHCVPADALTRLRHQIVVETLRTLLAGQRYASILTYTFDEAHADPTTHWFVEEAKIVALARTSHLRDAQRRLARSIDFGGPAIRLIFILRRAELLAAMGHQAFTTRAIEGAAMSFLAEGKELAPLNRLHCLERLVRVLATADSPLAMEFAELGSAATKILPDAPLRASFLAVLANAGRRDYQEALTEYVSASGYPQLRKIYNVPLDTSRHEEATTPLFRDVISLTDGPASGKVP